MWILLFFCKKDKEAKKDFPELVLKTHEINQFLLMDLVYSIGMHRHLRARFVVPLFTEKFWAELLKLPSCVIQLLIQVIIKAINICNVSFLVSPAPHVKYFKLRTII